MDLIVALSEYYRNKCFTNTFFKIINIIMFENWHEIHPMGLCASLADKKTILNKHKNVTNILKLQHKTF